MIRNITLCAVKLQEVPNIFRNPLWTLGLCEVFLILTENSQSQAIQFKRKVNFMLFKYDKFGNFTSVSIFANSSSIDIFFRRIMTVSFDWFLYF